MKEQTRIFFCNKCKSSAYTTDGTEPVTCVAPFPARTSGICGGGYTEVTDRVDWIISTEVERRISERLPSEEERDKAAIDYVNGNCNNINGDLTIETECFDAGIEYCRSRLTENKQEGK